MFRWLGFLQHQCWLRLPTQWMSGGALSIALLLSPSAYAGVSSGLTVTINQQPTQADPVPLNGTTNTRFVAVFSAAITPGSFTPSDVVTTGSTAAGIVVQSVTEIAPMNGTTFEIVASATSVGTVVLNVKGPGVNYAAITPALFSTPTNPYQIIAYADKVYVGTYNGGGLYEINTTTNTTRLFSNLNGDGSTGTVTARDGFIYCAGYQTGYTNIYRFTPDGTRTNMGTAGTRYFTVDSKGNVFFTLGTKIGKITPDGIINNNWLTLSNAVYMPAIDSEDNIFVQGDLNIIKVTPAGVVSTLATGFQLVGTSSNIKMYKDELYVISQLAPDSRKNIKKIDQQGNVSVVFDFTKSNPGINDILDVEIAADGRTWLIHGIRASSGYPVFFSYDPVANTHQLLLDAQLYAGQSVSGGLAISPAGMFIAANSGTTYKIASGTPAPTVTDLNGNSSAASTSTDNVVTLKTVAEMQAIAQAKIVAYANDNTNPAPTLDDYTLLGVTGVTVANLAIVNTFIDASTGPDVDTQVEVQGLVDTINAALQAIVDAQAKIVAYANDKTNPAPTLVDYQTLGVTGVTATHLAAVNANVDAATGPDVDTQGEVQALVDRVNAAQAKIVAYANDNTQPAPTVTDYQTLGVTGVTAANLTIVNAVVDARTGVDVDTAPEVQALVNGVAAVQAKIIAYANDNTQPAPTVADYQVLGVTGVTAGNLALVNAAVDAKTGVDVDTVPEVQALVNAALAAQAKIVAYANDNTQPAPTLADYQILGVTGVTAGNLAVVNAAVDAKTGVDVDTVPEVQALVNAVNAGLAAIAAAQAKIVAYANDNTQPAPTVTDYQTLGVTGVTAGNLAVVNAAVDARTGVDVDTTPEVQALVNAVATAQAKIVAYANDNTQPAPTLTDYQTIGVTGVTAANLAAINTAVDAKTGVDVDTKPELQALVNAVAAAQAKIVVYATDNTQPAPTLADYQALGVTGVTAANLAAVNAAVDARIGADVNTIPEVQAVVNTVTAAQAKIVAYANDNTQPAPTLADYQAIGVTGVTAGNLATLNSRVDALIGPSVDTTAKVQALLSTLALQVRGFLQGSFLPNVTSMADTLRTAGVIPSLQPYAAAPFSYAGSETLLPSLLSTAGNNAMVDWVLVELRDKTTPATRIASMAAVLQRNGDVVDARNGSTLLTFSGMATGDYYVVLRHRNHLAVMTAAAMPLTNMPTLVDFTLKTTATYGGVNAREMRGAAALLWAGDADGNNKIIANGPGNDLNYALTKVLTNVSNLQFNVNYVLPGYDSGDFNLSGQTIFAGPNNDVNLVVGNALLHPNNQSYSGNFIILGTVP